MKNTMILSGGSRSSGVRGAEKSHTGNSECCRQMHRTRVVSDEEVEVGQDAGELPQVEIGADQRVYLATLLVDPNP